MRRVERAAEPESGHVQPTHRRLDAAESAPSPTPTEVSGAANIKAYMNRIEATDAVVVAQGRRLRNSGQPRRSLRDVSVRAAGD